MGLSTCNSGKSTGISDTIWSWIYLLQFQGPAVVHAGSLLTVTPLWNRAILNVISNTCVRFPLWQVKMSTGEKARRHWGAGGLDRKWFKFVPTVIRIYFSFPKPSHRE